MHAYMRNLRVCVHAVGQKTKKQTVGDRRRGEEMGKGRGRERQERERAELSSRNKIDAVVVGAWGGAGQHDFREERHVLTPCFAPRLKGFGGLTGK